MGGSVGQWVGGSLGVLDQIENWLDFGLWLSLAIFEA